MKAKTAYHESKTWQRKSRVIYLFHLKCVLKKDKWTYRDTAKYFGISLGMVSESILLIKCFEIVRDYKSRNAALKGLRGYKK